MVKAQSGRLDRESDEIEEAYLRAIIRCLSLRSYRNSVGASKIAAPIVMQYLDKNFSITRLNLTLSDDGCYDLSGKNKTEIVDILSNASRKFLLMEEHDSFKLTAAIMYLLEVNDCRLALTLLNHYVGLSGRNNALTTALDDDHKKHQLLCDSEEVDISGMNILSILAQGGYREHHDGSELKPFLRMADNVLRSASTDVDKLGRLLSKRDKANFTPLG